MRLERFRALYRAFADIDPAWLTLGATVREALERSVNHARPRGRRVTGRASGARYRRFWDRALASIDVPGAGTRELKDVVEDGVVDAAWLAEHVLQGLSP